MLRPSDIQSNGKPTRGLVCGQKRESIQILKYVLYLVRGRGLCFCSAPTPGMLNSYLTHYRRALSPAPQKEGVQISSPVIITPQVQRYFSQRASGRTTLSTGTVAGELDFFPICTFVIRPFTLTIGSVTRSPAEGKPFEALIFLAKPQLGRRHPQRCKNSQPLSLARTGPPSLSCNTPKCMIDNLPVNSSTL